MRKDDTGSQGTGPRELDGGFSKALPHHGRVRLELWTKDRKGLADPDTYLMTPGEALSLIQSLAGAAQRALKDQVS
jgi:hypothetical protein